MANEAAAKQTSSILKCSICQMEVTAETYATHIQTQHAPAQEVKSQERDNWSGSTDEIIVPKLAADFWSIGNKVTGKLDGFRELTFTDTNGDKRTGISYRLILDSPVTVNGEEESIIEIPPLTGIIAAFKSLKGKGYQPEKGDVWTIICTAITKSKRAGFSDSPAFLVNASRPKF